jgi:hypothetical protein
MARQPRVEHPLDPRVVGEEAGNRERVGAGSLDPERQGAQAAQHQPRLEGAEDRAAVVALAADRRPALVGASGDERARQHVAVTVQDFGR